MTDKLSELLQRRRCDAGRLLTVYHEIPQSHTEGYRTERVSQSESVIHIYEWGLAMIEARKMTWPADAGNEFLQVEKKFRDIVFENHLKDGKPVSERAVKLALGYWKDGSGVGAYHYTQALALLLKTDIKVSGMNRLSRPFFCPKVCQQHPDITGMWRKEEKNFGGG